MAPMTHPPDTLTVQVNGKPQQLPQGSSVAELLVLLAVPVTRCAVEVNRCVVSRSAHGSHLLAQGDELEIVTFVGGG